MSSLARSILPLAILALAVAAAGCNASLPRNAPLLPGSTAAPGTAATVHGSSYGVVRGDYGATPSTISTPAPAAAPAPAPAPMVRHVQRRPVNPAAYRPMPAPAGTWRPSYPSAPGTPMRAPMAPAAARPRAPLPSIPMEDTGSPEEEEPTPEQIVQPGHGNPVDPSRPMTIDEFIEWREREQR